MVIKAVLSDKLPVPSVTAFVEKVLGNPGPSYK